MEYRNSIVDSYDSGFGGSMYDASIGETYGSSSSGSYSSSMSSSSPKKTVGRCPTGGKCAVCTGLCKLG